MQIRTYVASDQNALIDLWQRCGLLRPWNDPVLDIERKLREQPDGLLVGDIQGELMASVMVGYDGHRGWPYYLAVSPKHQGAGHGRALMAAAEAWLLARGGPKMNLQVRTGNEAVIGFYRALGYEVDAVVSLGKRLVHDAPPSPT